MRSPQAWYSVQKPTHGLWHSFSRMGLGSTGSADWSRTRRHNTSVSTTNTHTPHIQREDTSCSPERRLGSSSSRRRHAEQALRAAAGAAQRTPRGAPHQPGSPQHIRKRTIVATTTGGEVNTPRTRSEKRVAEASFARCEWAPRSDKSPLSVQQQQQMGYSGRV